MNEYEVDGMLKWNGKREGSERLAQKAGIWCDGVRGGGGTR